MDLERFFNGEGYDSYKYFGAHPLNNGYVFRVFARWDMARA